MVRLTKKHLDMRDASLHPGPHPAWPCGSKEKVHESPSALLPCSRNGDLHVLNAVLAGWPYLARLVLEGKATLLRPDARIALPGEH
jgi:hypothetical protein